MQAEHKPQALPLILRTRMNKSLQALAYLYTSYEKRQQAKGQHLEISKKIDP